jgi:hypothetical protein
MPSVGLRREELEAVATFLGHGHILGSTRACEACTTPVGAGLLAKAVDQSTLMLNVKPHSRASPLPQGEQPAEPISSGKRAA